MKILVVTTYNNKLLQEYAHKFESTFCWPFDKKVYNEDGDFFTQVPQLKRFVERNKDRPVPHYINDGVRFSYKVYAYTDAILKNESYDGIIGIDADSIFYKTIDVEWIKKHIHRDDCMMSYLGRPSYSECGFLYFNMRNPYTKPFAREMQKMYDEDLIYKEAQQHDSFIWDLVRRRVEQTYGVNNHNLGDGRDGHVQARTILGSVYDHTKGSRKQKGKSPESRI